MLENTNKLKTYLVYQLIDCEMGSEGWSYKTYLCVAQGNTKHEVVKNWVENVKALYGVDLHPKYNSTTKTYSDYYPIVMTPLITEAYGRATPYRIDKGYEGHEQ